VQGATCKRLRSVYLQFASEPCERASRTECDLPKRFSVEANCASERVGGPRGEAPGSINGEVAEWLKAAVC
jgi:hypothetical protein